MKTDKTSGADPLGPPFGFSDPCLEITRVIRVFPNASTSPAEAETADGKRWVLKFSGAGPGPYGLLVEYIGLAVAQAFGAPVPTACPLRLPEGFPWMAGTDEFDSMLQRSTGWNLGIALIPDARAARMDEALGCASTVLEAIARADCFLMNMDRGRENANLLIGGGRFWAIDYDACLYLTRALGPRRAPETTLPEHHFLRERFPEPARWPMPVIDFDKLLLSAPSEWVSTTGRSSADVAQALKNFAGVWAREPG